MNRAEQNRPMRVPLEGSVTLDDGQRRLTCTVGNLSRTGILVSGQERIDAYVQSWLKSS